MAGFSMHTESEQPRIKSRLCVGTADEIEGIVIWSGWVAKGPGTSSRGPVRKCS